MICLILLTLQVVQIPILSWSHCCIPLQWGELNISILHTSCCIYYHRLIKMKEAAGFVASIYCQDQHFNCWNTWMMMQIYRYLVMYEVHDISDSVYRYRALSQGTVFFSDLLVLYSSMLWTSISSIFFLLSTEENLKLESWANIFI